MEDLDPGLRAFGQLVGDAAGAVRGVVVDDQDAVAFGKACRDRFDDRADVLTSL